MSEVIMTPGDRVAAFISKMFKTARGRDVIDVGANLGGYTHIFLENGARRVVAIEPGPGCVVRMRERFTSDPRVSIRQEGISDAPGKLEGVRHHSAWTLAKPGVRKDGRLRDPSPGAAEIEGETVFDVTLVTIDQVARDEGLADVALLKIDTDGYDAKAFRGAQETIRKHRPVIYIELSAYYQDIGEDVPAFFRNVEDQAYVIVQADGRTATAAQALRGFPWHSSYDVFLLPNEHRLLPAERLLTGEDLSRGF